MKRKLLIFRRDHRERGVRRDLLEVYPAIVGAVLGIPRPDSPGLGLGLPLIATLTESLELGTGEDDATEVRMTFRVEG